MAGAGGVLLSGDDAAVRVVAHNQPSSPARIGAAMDLGQQPLGDAITPPALEAAGTVFQEPYWLARSR